MDREFRSTFKFKDGTVIDHPWVKWELDMYSLETCEISPLLLQDGNFRGFVRVRYNGDGHATPIDAATRETYATMKEALDAVKKEAIEKYGPEFIS